MTGPAGIRLVAVVAASRNGVIGRDGAMPWHLPGDLKRYRALTMGRPMVMGRRTLEAIGRVLDGRDTIVLTRRASLPFAGAIPAGSPDEALRLAAGRAAARGTDEIVIVGGGEIYALFWPRIDRLVLTRVEIKVAGDTRLPPVETSGLVLVSDEPCPRDPRDSADTRLLVYERRG